MIKVERCYFVISCFYVCFVPQVKLFFDSIREQTSQLRTTQLALDNVQKNIRWVQRNLETLRNWLQEQMKQWQIGVYNKKDRLKYVCLYTRFCHFLGIFSGIILFVSSYGDQSPVLLQCNAIFGLQFRFKAWFEFRLLLGLRLALGMHCWCLGLD